MEKYQEILQGIGIGATPSPLLRPCLQAIRGPRSSGCLLIFCFGAGACDRDTISSFLLYFRWSHLHVVLPASPASGPIRATRWVSEVPAASGIRGRVSY